MDNLLIDRETLGRFVDELIKKKPLSVNTTEELNVLREKSIQELDDKIAIEIFGKLTPEQYTELKQMLDRPDASESDYKQFFERTNIDMEQSILDAVRSFSSEFLGGQNAE